MPGPLTIEYQAGKEIHAGDTTLTPFTSTWRLHALGSNFAATWNRPASVLVRAADGQEQNSAHPRLDPPDHLVAARRLPGGGSFSGHYLNGQSQVMCWRW